MSNLSEDPKVQKLIEKALKAQRKSIVDAVKEEVDVCIDDAKDTDEPDKAVIKALKAAKAKVLEAAKTAEPA